MIRRGLVLEGLFRVPGSHNVISSVCEAARHGTQKKNRKKIQRINNFLFVYYPGLVPDFDQPDCCLEEVSGVFKKYIRELPSPLFIDDTPENKLHQEFTKVMECMSKNFEFLFCSQ